MPDAKTRSRPISTSLLVAGFFGLALVAYLIIDSGTGEVASAMLVVGWGLFPITAFHIIPLFFSSLSWRELLPPSDRPGILSLAWMRWIRESINSLLPVASIGGDIAGARLAHLHGVPGTQAAASMIVDTTVGAVTQLIFVLSGVALLGLWWTENFSFNVLSGLLAGIAALVAGIAFFIFFQHKNMFARFVRLMRRLLPQNLLSDFERNASEIDDAIMLSYRSGAAFWRAIALRLIGWAAGAGEIWLVMYFLGQPFSVVEAFILESLSSGVRAAAFAVPAALGVQEGGLVLFGSLFGIPPEMALAISLSKRVRELLLGLPGLLAWYWGEGHHLLRRNRG
ncbi:MAG TPA: lysylphosphatidylglycerol synthase domain-containing protein [Pseudolabrys sp.]|nr:lysylphosphatidylglycerol synthase domain-containing protein [Pseudolabrys sp.]